MLAYLNKILVILFIFIFTACSKIVDVNKNIDDTKKEKYSLEKKEEISFDAKASRNSKKVDELDISKFKDSILLKNKLLNCGIKYEPWKDRLDNDLVLQKKLLSICNDISFYSKDLVIHSQKEVNKGFILNKHVFIPSNWSKKQIYDYLISLKKSSKVVEKKQIVKQLLVQKTQVKKVDLEDQYDHLIRIFTFRGIQNEETLFHTLIQISKEESPLLYQVSRIIPVVNYKIKKEGSILYIHTGSSKKTIVSELSKM